MLVVLNGVTVLVGTASVVLNLWTTLGFRDTRFLEDPLFLFLAWTLDLTLGAELGLLVLDTNGLEVGLESENGLRLGEELERGLSLGDELENGLSLGEESENGLGLGELENGLRLGDGVVFCTENGDGSDVNWIAGGLGVGEDWAGCGLVGTCGLCTGAEGLVLGFSGRLKTKGS